MATRRYMLGTPFIELRELLRHKDDRSLRTYLDVVSVVANMTAGDSSRWHATAEVIRRVLWPMLHGVASVWKEIDAAAPRPLPRG